MSQFRELKHQKINLTRKKKVKSHLSFFCLRLITMEAHITIVTALDRYNSHISIFFLESLYIFSFSDLKIVAAHTTRLASDLPLLLVLRHTSCVASSAKGAIGHHYFKFIDCPLILVL